VPLRLDPEADADADARRVGPLAHVGEVAAGASEGKPEIRADEEVRDHLAADIEDEGDLRRERVGHRSALPLLDLSERDGDAGADRELKAGMRRRRAVDPLHVIGRGSNRARLRDRRRGNGRRLVRPAGGRCRCRGRRELGRRILRERDA